MSELDTKEFYDNQMDREGIVLSKDQIPSSPVPAPELTGWMAIPLEHTRSCQHWSGDSPSSNPSGCTCCLEERIGARNWMELHNARRKRAEEAEAELNQLRPVPAPEDISEMLDELQAAQQNYDAIKSGNAADRLDIARVEILALVSRLRSQVRRMEIDSARMARWIIGDGQFVESYPEIEAICRRRLSSGDTE